MSRSTLEAWNLLTSSAERNPSLVEFLEKDTEMEIVACDPRSVDRVVLVQWKSECPPCREDRELVAVVNAEGSFVLMDLDEANTYLIPQWISAACFPSVL
jgi:thiol-disulfide isomerase/thioredoxin